MTLEISQTRELILSKIEGGNEGWPLNIESENVYEAYKQIGYKYIDPIQNTAATIYNNPSLKPERIRRANTALNSLQSLAYDSEFEDAYLVREYLTALQGWADGAGISLEAAAVLQDDNTGGCQTCAVRLADDFVLLAHTEEESMDIERISGPPAITLNIDGEEQITVAYPDLLPGSSTFSATGKSAVACDFLWLKDIDNGKNLINSLTWMVWRMGEKANPGRVEKLIKKMHPFVDGLAMTVVTSSPDGTVNAFKTTAAGNEFKTEILGNNPGDSLYQVTIIDRKYKEEAPLLFALATPEEQHEDYLEKYIARLNVFQTFFSHKTLKQRISELSQMENEKIHRTAHNFMSHTTRVADGWDMANSSVMMTCSSLIRSGKGNSIKLKLGAAEKNNSEFEKNWIAY